jgi:hypothetical protein
MKLGDSSVGGHCPSYKKPDVTYKAEANKQFTPSALAKATTLRQSALSHARLNACGSRQASVEKAAMYMMVQLLGG